MYKLQSNHVADNLNGWTRGDKMPAERFGETMMKGLLGFLAPSQAARGLETALTPKPMQHTSAAGKSNLCQTPLQEQSGHTYQHNSKRGKDLTNG